MFWTCHELVPVSADQCENKVIFLYKFSICLECRDILFYSIVNWLSHGYVLSTFIGCLEAIKEILEKKTEKLSWTEKWKLVVKVYVSDCLNAHLNQLKLKLQEKGQTVLDLFSYWKALTQKIVIFTGDISIKVFKYFANVKQNFVTEVEIFTSMDVGGARHKTV